jgi:hypothetical protein
MTNQMNNAPTPEFRAHLESEVSRAFRREARLGGLAREPQRGRVRALSFLVICLGVGAASGILSAQVRDLSRRDSLLDAARAELAIMSLRLDLARAQSADAARKSQIGGLDPDGVASAESELRSMETRAARAKLNIDEIGLGSQPPRDDLNAPLVGGRDFVTERIRLDLVNAQQQLSAAERTLATVDRRVRVGAVPELARGEAELDVTRANAALAVLAERLSLRRAFVENATPADELARRLETARLRQDVRVAQQALELAKARAANLDRRRAVGSATELDALRAQVEVMERELELSRLMEQLRRMGGERDSAT